MLRREKERSFLEKWCLDLIERRGINRATVALANKMGRMVWALLVKEEDYKVQLIG
jgi:transposase